MKPVIQVAAAKMGRGVLERDLPAAFSCCATAKTYSSIASMAQLLAPICKPGVSSAKGAASARAAFTHGRFKAPGFSAH